MNKYYLLGILLLILAALYFFSDGLNTNRGTNQTEQVTAETTPATPQVLGVYEGRLPCADCEGIDTVLTLYVDNTYEMSSTYIGKEVQPFIEKGQWATVKGDATNPEATVYQLDSTGATVQNYLLVDDNTLQQLDSEKQPINSPFDLTLKKKISS